ncbi:MAG: PP2C family serine/threonine-protein phosphatase [Pyrinomonadaceae bacterium]
MPLAPLKQAAQQCHDGNKTPDEVRAAPATAKTPAPEAWKADEKNARAMAALEWRVIGETVPGASHIRAGIPNQDALLQLRASSIALPIILSVSDGHGSNKCFRSDRGSRFAVHLVGALLSETLNEIYSGAHENVQDLAKFEEQAKNYLTVELVKRWRSVVEADLAREPLQETEFARLIEKDGARARALVEANPYLAYGATLLAVALTSSFALYMQLGDGEILNVAAAGDVTQPLPEDARLLANETTSLCLPKAAEDFRFSVQALTNPPPAIILLTTDGYANSFSTAAGFHQVGGDLISMMRADGFDAVNRSVKSWLEEATQAGSGDDCTLALIVRMNALEAHPSSTTVGGADSHEQPASSKTA